MVFISGPSHDSRMRGGRAPRATQNAHGPQNSPNLNVGIQRVSVALRQPPYMATSLSLMLCHLRCTRVASRVRADRACAMCSLLMLTRLLGVTRQHAPPVCLSYRHIGGPTTVLKPWGRSISIVSCGTMPVLRRTCIRSESSP